MKRFVSFVDIREALNELSNSKAAGAVAKLSNNHLTQVEWSKDLGLDSLEKLELAQIIEKKCGVNVVEKSFTVSSDKVGDFIRAVNGLDDDARKVMTVLNFREAVDVLTDTTPAKQIYRMPDDILLNADIYKDLGFDSLDLAELVMIIEKQNKIYVSVEPAEMGKDCTVQHVLDMCNEYGQSL